MCFSLWEEFIELFLWSGIIYWWEMRCQLRKFTVSPNSLSCGLLRNLQAHGILQLTRATPNRGQALGFSGEMLIRTHWRSFKQPVFYGRMGWGWTYSSQCFHGVEKEILMCFQALVRSEDLSEPDHEKCQVRVPTRHGISLVSPLLRGKKRLC